MATTKLNLKEIHDRLFFKLDLEKRASRDNIIASEIQQLLMILKNNQTNSMDTSHPVNAMLQEQADILIESATKLLNIKGNRKLSTNQLFRRRHKSVQTRFGGDDIFEEELAAVIASIESEATGQNIDITSKLVGGDLLTIEVEKLSKRITKKLAEKDLNQVRKNTSDVKNISARSGKTDVLGTTNEYTGTLNPQWERLFKLFQGKTFSVKNYSSYNKDIVNISLGATNYGKAIMGSLRALGYSVEDQERILWQGLKSKRTSAVAEHFYHLQYGYELMGLGLGSKKSGEFQEAQQVDFFIYNDPSSDLVVVRSTAQMLLNALNNMQKATHLMKSITITADKL